MNNKMTHTQQYPINNTSRKIFMEKKTTPTSINKTNKHKYTTRNKSRQRQNAMHTHITKQHTQTHN